MKPLALLALSTLALGLAACDSGSGSSSATGSTTDVKTSDLTAADKAFLAKLGGTADAFGALQQSSNRGNAANGAIAARKASFLDSTCTSPQITHDVFWELGSADVDSGTPGARRVSVDDTTAVYDVASGTDVTCDVEAQFSGSAGTRSVFKQAMIEGDLLTTSTNGTFFSRTDTAARIWEMRFSMKGRIRYTDGFTLVVDSASASFQESFADNSAEDPTPADLYYHLTFDGYPYTAVLRYDKTDNSIVGDVLRGNSRIGTMKVLRDDSMKVLDLDGNPINP
jgi:hypothetical protein